MDLNFAKYLIIILLLTSCKNQETEIKNYGYPNNENGNLNVSLELSEFKNYGKLIDKLREISCNDSVPKIVITEQIGLPINLIMGEVQLRIQLL